MVNGGGNMAQDLFSLMQKLAPDLTEEAARRALILERIGTLQPVGRRQLASSLRLPEREIRNTAVRLAELGYIETNASGMRLLPAAAEILQAADAFSRAYSGITEMEATLSARLGVRDVVIARGDADADERVLQDVGRRCAERLRAMLKNGDTLAVTGGRTLAAVVQGTPTGSPLNVMVVPARGGRGRSAELQANTIASGLAVRLGGHYRLMHAPDRLDPTALQEMMKLPEVSEVTDRIQRANILLHGISDARENMADAGLTRKEQAMLRERGACAECFGAYFDLAGNCLLKVPSVGVDLGRLNPECQRIAAAAGASKAEAILAVLRHDPHQVLVTDEGAAERMLALLNEVALPPKGMATIEDQKRREDHGEKDD